MARPPGDGVFTGVRVLELAEGIAGPYAAMFLADQGADVVKLESPGGDPYRADPGFQTINRNKRSAVAGEDARAALIAAADVIVVDRPGAAAEVRSANPGAVVLAMPPWGERGPMVDHPTSRTILHAATGIAWNQQSYGEVPVDIIVPIASYGAGILGALAAATGLLVRAATGRPVTYEVSEVAGAAAIQLGEASLAGDEGLRPGDSTLGSKGRVACYRLVEAGDGRWLFLACGTSRFYYRMLDVIGRPDLADDPLLADPPWGLLADEAIERLTPILDEAFATRDRDEWLRLLAEADVPAQPVLTRDEFLASSVVAANEMDVSVDHPELGPVAMMGVPVTVEGAPGSVRSAAPLLGAHTDEVIADWADHELARRWPSVPAAQDGNGDGGEPAVLWGPSKPLDGVRVIDLASFIAGPVVSRHLAMLGAEVIKIEAPTGDPFRAIGPMFESWNQGKQSVVLDLTTEEGQAMLHRLAATADVVIENFRPGVATRLGVDADTLAAVNPDLVLVSSPGFGLDETMAARPAFDPLVQAIGGFMAAQGGLIPGPDGVATGSEPVFLTVPIHDVVTPMIGAFGAVLGLWQRHHRGEGQRVRTSLAQSTMASQAAEYTRYAGRPDPEGGGFDHPGPPGDTWHPDGDRLVWRAGDGEAQIEVEVCRVGLTRTDLAAANDLLTHCDHPLHGPMTVFGQLVGGAGPAPAPSPALDANGPDIRGELAAGTDIEAGAGPTSA